MPPPPGGPLGKAGKDLTYAELHVQHEGKAEVVRLDSGEVIASSDSSITIKENDGNEVTIAVDDKTKVLPAPARPAVTDLKQGQQVAGLRARGRCGENDRGSAQAGPDAAARRAAGWTAADARLAV